MELHSTQAANKSVT
jgi:hypothetical protein